MDRRMLLRSDAAGDNSSGGGRASDNEGNVEQRRQLDEVVALGQALERLQVRMSMGMPISLHLQRGQPCGETHGCAEVPAIHAPEMRFASAFFTAAGPWCHWTGAAVAVAGANAPSISHTTDVCTKSIARM